MSMSKERATMKKITENKKELLKIKNMIAK